MLKILSVVSIITILEIGVSRIDAGNDGTQQPAQIYEYSEFKLPPKVMDLLRKEGVTITDLKNDSDLRRRWLGRLRVLGGVEPGKSAGTRDDFYQVIITNNLFRSLGYRKPSTPRRINSSPLLLIVNMGTTGHFFDGIRVVARIMLGLGMCSMASRLNA